MNVEIKPIKEKSQVELKIKASADELKPYLTRAASKLSQDKPLKGFRPGKAPLKVVMEVMGKERVLSEALDRALPRFFVEALLDHDIEALGRPATTIDELDMDKGLAFTAIVDVMPEVTAGDVSVIKAQRHRVEVTDGALDKELKYLAKTRSTFLEVARPAQEGDTVTVDFKVSMDGQAMKGGESKNHPVHIGEGHFVPGFEEKIKGIQAGDEREFDITFPPDFSNKELQGKQAHVWVKAHAVQKRVIPAINDEFAKKVGKFTGLDNLKEEMKKNLLAEKERKERERIWGELMQQLAMSSSFGAIPESLIEREIDHRLEELAQLLSYQNKTVADYLSEQKKDIKQVRDELREEAVKSVKTSLALRAFADQEKIEATDEEIEREVQNYLNRYPSAEEAKKQVNEERLRQEVKSLLRNQKTLQLLEEKAEITDINKVSE
ncbi:MAG: trigger factor [bacterium]|nr:trigger factor [bacterium]